MTTPGFSLTQKQQEAQKILASDAKHIMLFGGSRSGKTFLLVRNVVLRALKAKTSRHAILRFRFNSLKASVVLDTFPKVMQIAFPGVSVSMNKTDWYAQFENGSQIWFGGLDDKERTEKILGMEFATIYLNECSQIPWQSVGIAVTRLAQQVEQHIDGCAPALLKPRMYYDCNPPSKAHWTYKLFMAKQDPETRQPVGNTADYASFRINPNDNAANISADYLETLASLSSRNRRRFLDGEFSEATPNQLFPEQDIDRWRVLGGELPTMQRIVVGVDPSGASDDEQAAEHDAVGVVVAGLADDGNAYVLEDCTVHGGPAKWGNVAVQAYRRHNGDAIVAETNFGGGMVEFVIRTADQFAPVRQVHASRGKVVRAEPFSALYEQGRIRHVGRFDDLEDEMAAFSTSGYTGERSPNRADALFWALTELFPGVISGPQVKEDDAVRQYHDYAGDGGWMG